MRRNIAIVGNAGRSRPKNRLSCEGRSEKMWSSRRFSEGQGEMQGSSHGENVRPVRARTRDVKREERERVTERERYIQKYILPVLPAW